MPTTIYSQQLSSDGLSVVGPAHRLIGASQSWEGNLVEGPSMIQNGNTFWLFYSANLWGTDNYGIGVAQLHLRRRPLHQTARSCVALV